MKVVRNISLALLMMISVFILSVCALGLEIPIWSIVIFGVLVFCSLLLIIITNMKNRK